MTVVSSLLNAEPRALFDRVGLQITPTVLTQGPWSADVQHGGAPAAFLGGELERIAHQRAMLVVKLGFDFLKPVPIAPMRLATRSIRDGRKMMVLEARLIVDGQTVVRATATALRRLEAELPSVEKGPLPPPPPEAARPVRMVDHAGAYANEAMEIRVVHGDFAEPGAAAGWFRLRVPVITGTTPSAIENVCAAADFGNGLSNWIPDRSWIFINPDLTIHLARPPVEEWTYLDSRSFLEPVGTGVSESRLFDLSGHLGRSTQSLLVEPVDAQV